MYLISKEDGWNGAGKGTQVAKDAQYGHHN